MRHFLSVAAFGLLCAGSAWASVDTGLLALVAPGAKIIVGTDMAQLQSSVFGQFLLNKMQASDVQKAMNEAGVNLGRDLQSVVFAMSEIDAKSGRPKSWALLARGHFDAAKLKATATADGGAKVIKYGGLDVLVGNKNQPEDDAAVTFLEGGVTIVADKNTVKQIIDRRAATRMADADVERQINSIGAKNDFWTVVSMSSASLLAMRKGEPLPEAFRSIESVTHFSVGIKLGDTIDTTIDAGTRSADDAESLAGAIHFIAAMAQMEGQKDPNVATWAKLLDGMTVENSGPDLHWVMSLPEKSLEQLAELGQTQGGKH